MRTERINYDNKMKNFKFKRMRVRLTDMIKG